jgi:hypothetical protein
MTVMNIGGYVYGLGLALFVFFYASAMVSLHSLESLMLGLLLVCADDVVVRWNKDTAVRRATIFASFILSSAAMRLVTATAAGPENLSDYWSSASTIAFEVALPACTPVLVMLLRRPAHYPPRVVVELIHFAMPFAFILAAAVCLCLDPELPAARPIARTHGNLSLHGTLLRNVTKLSTQANYSGLSPYENLYIYPLLPLTLIPIVFFAVQSALLYSTADFTACVALVAAGKLLVLHGDRAQDAALALCVGGISFMLRVYACCQDEGDKTGFMYYEDEEEAVPLQQEL